MGIIKKIIFEIRMHFMDFRWRMSVDRSCFDFYPPSFYYRYTPEERKKLIDKDMTEIRKMLEDFQEKHCI